MRPRVQAQHGNITRTTELCRAPYPRLPRPAHVCWTRCGVVRRAVCTPCTPSTPRAPIFLHLSCVCWPLHFFCEHARKTRANARVARPSWPSQCGRFTDYLTPRQACKSYVYRQSIRLCTLLGTARALQAWPGGRAEFVFHNGAEFCVLKHDYHDTGPTGTDGHPTTHRMTSTLAPMTSVQTRKRANAQMRTRRHERGWHRLPCKPTRPVWMTRNARTICAVIPAFSHRGVG